MSITTSGTVILRTPFDELRSILAQARVGLGRKYRARANCELATPVVLCADTISDTHSLSSCSEGHMLSEVVVYTDQLSPQFLPRKQNYG